MIELDALWEVPRYSIINGRKIRVPFGVNLEVNLVTPIKKWITCSGLQFAAKRVKALKVWALQILSGNQNYSEPWIAKAHYRGFVIPKLKIFQYLVDHLHDLKVIRLVLIVLNSYKLIVIGEPSLSSIQDVETSPEPDHYIQKLRLYVKLPNVPIEKLESVKSVDTKTKYCDDYGETHDGPYGEIENDFFTFLGGNPVPKCIGRLVPIKDKGKWRTILVGHHLLQLSVKKLADWLRSWLWNQPEIASGDQKKMTEFCISNLNKGKFMLSIDLSEATDRLSRRLQVKLLESMGVPRDYFTFLSLPCFYRDKDFGGTSDELKKAYYSNGQPMGLFISFPMFELTHFVLLKWVISAFKESSFSICGDDVVIACREEDSGKIYQRYVEIISRFGGRISTSKTLKSSRVAEGVGAIFLKGYNKEVRIPNGKLSNLEGFCPGTWLNSEIVNLRPIGRAILFSWLSTKLEKEYTYDQRRMANESVVSKDLSFWSNEALRSLFRLDHEPIVYSRFDDDQFSFWRKTPDREDQKSYHWVSLSVIQEALVSNRIISLYKTERK